MDPLPSSRSSLHSTSEDDELPQLDPLSRRFSSAEVLTRNAPAGKIWLPRHVHLRQGSQNNNFVELRPLSATSLLSRGGSSESEDDGEAGFRDPPQPYHVFSKQKKLRLAYLVSLAAVFSPLSSNIYFPALNTISAVSGDSLELGWTNVMAC
jgi:hypothetical protein